MRFGMGLSSMHVSRPDRRDRLLLISALAIAVLSLLGAAGERIGYDRWLKANTVKRRTHSLFRQGLMLYHHLPNWPQQCSASRPTSGPRSLSGGAVSPTTWSR